jgi:hypothetical protein
MKRRPFSVISLAAFALIASATAFYYALQFLHLLPFSSGSFKSWQVDFFSAFLCGLIAALYLCLVRPIWNQQAKARLLAIIIAAFSLFLGLVSLFAGISLQNLLPSFIAGYKNCF